MLVHQRVWKPHIHYGLGTSPAVGCATLSPHDFSQCPFRFSSTWQWKRVNWMKFNQNFQIYRGYHELPWTTYKSVPKSEIIHGYVWYEFDPHSWIWMDMNQHFQPVDFPHDFPPQSRSQEFTTKLDGKVDNVAWKEVSRACRHHFWHPKKTDQPEDWYHLVI